MIEYRMPHVNEINRELFRHFKRHQAVTKCWRKISGVWCIKDIAFTDEWTERDYAFLVSCLKNTVQTVGSILSGTTERFCFRGIRLIRQKQGISGSVQHSCIGRYARQRNRQGVIPHCEKPGKAAWCEETVYFRALRSGKPGILPCDGLCGSTGIQPGACGKRALRLSTGMYCLKQQS